MPYSKKRYGSKEQWKKYKRCVDKVSEKDDKVNPYAVCRSSIYGKSPERRKKYMIWLKQRGYSNNEILEKVHKKYPYTMSQGIYMSDWLLNYDRKVKKVI